MKSIQNNGQTLTMEEKKVRCGMRLSAMERRLNKKLIREGRIKIIKIKKGE